MKRILLTMALVLCSVAATAAEISVDNERGDLVVETVASPFEKADVIIDFTPSRDHDLDRVEPTERFIDGQTTKVEKGLAPVNIVHIANAFTQPLKKGAPVRLFLKRFPDREAYYIIAVFPVAKGAKQ